MYFVQYCSKSNHFYALFSTPFNWQLTEASTDIVQQNCTRKITFTVGCCEKSQEANSCKTYIFIFDYFQLAESYKQRHWSPSRDRGLATHLHYHEPSNFVLVSFLQGGLFHELCEPGRNGKSSNNGDLVHFEQCNIP